MVNFSTFILTTLSLFNFKESFKANYIKLPALPPAIGCLAENYKLTNATYLALNKLIGPETVTFSSSGVLYAGLANGQIVTVKLDENSSQQVSKVVQIGDETNETICNDLSTGFKESCGRPLGIRFKPNTKFLYVADAFRGIYRVDTVSMTKTLILSSYDTRFEERPMRIVNDLEFDRDFIYFVDSSCRRSINSAVQEILEAFPAGRLFRYNEKTNDLELLLDELYFPNGIQMMPDKKSVLINECTAAKITRYYISGDKQGTVEQWASLPGHGDTIRTTSKNTLLVPMAISRYGSIPSLLDLLGESPKIRSLFGTVFKVGEIFNLLPKYGLLVEYDLDGNPINSWHDPTGKCIEQVTSAELRDNKLYLGSIFNSYIGVVDYY